MSQHTGGRRSRWALAVGLTVTTGLTALGAGFPGGPAHADPTPDCAEPFPVAELTEGQVVEGLTVDNGTTPEPFTGTVLGVLEDGIAPGLDMIMMELDSAAIDKAGGIWQGMSGSPVYADDRLIGAVAYGLAWGTTPIAGVTPFEDMDDYLGAAAAPGPVSVDRADARTIAATGEATTAQAEQGFEHLPVPMGVVGVRQERIADGQARAYLPETTHRMGVSSSTAAAPVDALIAGGNLAAIQSKGDITFAGVGTVTSVCDGRLVGFGHPMMFSGRTSLAMGAASAIYVQEDPLGVPFKVANIGDIGGTITDDRLAGIAGDFGPAPDVATFTSDVTYGDKHREGFTEIFVPSALAAIAYYGSIANHDRVIDGIQPGSETQAWVIEGTHHDVPFTLNYDDRYESTSDVTWAGIYDLPDVLYMLSLMDGVEVTSVENTAVVSDEGGRFSLRKVEQKVGTKWVNVTNDPAKVTAGTTLRLRLTLLGPDGEVKVPYELAIPKSLAGKNGKIALVGGDSQYSDIYEAEVFEDIEEILATQARNDEIQALVNFGKALQTAENFEVLDLVVRGKKTVEVRVR